MFCHYEVKTQIRCWGTDGNVKISLGKVTVVARSVSEAITYAEEGMAEDEFIYSVRCVDIDPDDINR